MHLRLLQGPCLEIEVPPGFLPPAAPGGPLIPIPPVDADADAGWTVGPHGQEDMSTQLAQLTNTTVAEAEPEPEPELEEQKKAVV